MKYYFYLQDAIGQSQISDSRPRMVPEFLVCFEVLTRIAAEYGLTLVKKMNFLEYYADKTAHNSPQG